MSSIVNIQGLSKTYASGHVALKHVDLSIAKGEIFALLGPNGAGKTTMISIVCGILAPSEGSVTVDGVDVLRDYRNARARIGFVPQELQTDSFETVLANVRFSRRLFGCVPNDAYIERLLRDLSLWEQRDTKIKELSSGMKRRVMIGKALSHEPDVLFLDEPTSGVDVGLRREMWNLVRRLRDTGVTIVLTTHYIEEAEEMADRVGVISKGELILVEDKVVLMTKLGRKTLTLTLAEPLDTVPLELSAWPLALNEQGHALRYEFDSTSGHRDVPALLRALDRAGIAFKDLNTRQGSLEDIFVGLVPGDRKVWVECGQSTI